MDGESAIPKEQVRNVFGMWKRTAPGFVLTAGALAFGAVVLGVSFLAATDQIKAKPVTAEVLEVKADMPGEAATMAAKPVKVDYYLPYPGVLPDNPLYKIKAIRDRLSLWFEFDEEKKAKKELLFADKRINAAVFLTDGGKLALGVTTATKAEKYLDQAVNRAIKLEKNGKDVKSLIAELTKAATKHTEILDGLLLRSGGDEKKSLELTVATTRLMQERLGQAMLEAK